MTYVCPEKIVNIIGKEWHMNWVDEADDLKCNYFLQQLKSHKYGKILG